MIFGVLLSSLLMHSTGEYCMFWSQCSEVNYTRVIFIFTFFRLVLSSNILNWETIGHQNCSKLQIWVTVWFENKVITTKLRWRLKIDLSPIRNFIVSYHVQFWWIGFRSRMKHIASDDLIPRFKLIEFFLPVFVSDAAKFTGHKINMTESKRWSKSSIDCAARCGGNSKCKGFSTSTVCEHYEELPYNSGTLEADNIWLIGKFLNFLELCLSWGNRNEYHETLFTLSPQFLGFVTHLLYLQWPDPKIMTGFVFFIMSNRLWLFVLQVVQKDLWTISMGSIVTYLGKKIRLGLKHKSFVRVRILTSRNSLMSMKGKRFSTTLKVKNIWKGAMILNFEKSVTATVGINQIVLK